MKTKTFCIFLVLAILFSACKEKTSHKKENKKAKYVFFFIGDGMGTGHVALTESYLSALNDSIGFEKLSFSKFPITGFSTTYAYNRLITGSAAAGTALACGEKTIIGTIGLNPTFDTLWSIAHFAKNHNFKIGILSTVSINHATPAAYYAHQQKRGDYYKIAMQLHKSNFDLFAGGGFAYNKGKNDSLEDIYSITENNDYKIINSKNKFNNFSDKDGKKYLVSPNILTNASMPYAINQDKNMLNLADFTQKSIELLENPNGFFIMVEGGKIDWAAHNNDAATVIEEIIDFDNAVKKAIDFYNKHPDETLIIVSADHETGGLAVGCDKMGYKSNLKILKNQKGSLEAYIDSVKIKKKQNFSFEQMITFSSDFWGINKDSLNNDDLSALEQSFDKFINNNENSENQYSKSNPLANTWLALVNEKAGIGWTTGSHSANPVPVWAIGIGQEFFNGYYDNTDIPKKIAKIMGLNKFLEQQ